LNNGRWIDHAHPRGREPFFKGPAAVFGLAFALVALHGARLAFDLGAEPFALVPPRLWAGDALGLFTHMFVHADGVLHVGMNALAVLAFAAPTARLFGAGTRGVSLFLAFFAACGVLSGLSYAALYPNERVALVGASGAASAFAGSAARLIQGRGRLRPVFGRVTVGMSIAWIAVNAALGLSGLTPGAQGVPVAWQAHIAGFAAGMLLIGPFARLAGAPRWVFEPPSRVDHELER
jgi:membrane associated rhomboid family serine protease